MKEDANFKWVKKEVRIEQKDRIFILGEIQNGLVILSYWIEISIRQSY